MARTHPAHRSQTLELKFEVGSALASRAGHGLDVPTDREMIGGQDHDVP